MNISNINNKTRISICLALVLLLAISILGLAVLSQSMVFASAEETNEYEYVFESMDGKSYARLQTYNTFDLSIDLGSESFSIEIMTYFSQGVEYLASFLWLEGTAGPTDDETSISASALRDVASVVWYNDETHESSAFLMSDLVTIPDDTPLNVYYAECAVSDHGDTNVWEFMGVIGTIEKVTFEETYPLPVTPTKTGYTFTGWYTDEECTELYTLDYITESVTLYAGFRANTYTISFSSNADSYGTTSTGSMSNLSMTYDVAKNLTSNAFKITGYNFVGWSTDGRAQEADYTNGQSVKNLTAKDGGTVTLYALWEEANYTVKFNANGGSGTMANQTHREDISLALTANAFTKTGYHFLGWSKSSTATTATYTNGQSVKDIGTAGQTVNLYAIWAPNTYTIKFHGNSSTSGSMSNLSMTYDTAKNLTSNAFVRTGYKFMGWNTEQNSYDVLYTNGQSVNNLVTTNGGSITLYAIWEEVNYTVAFNNNGGSGTMANQTFQVGIAEALNANTFTKTGYHFDGWAESATGTVKYADKASVTSLASEGQTKTLYAVWVANTYTIKFNGNGSTSGSMSDLSMTYDTAKNLTSNAFVKTGYNFVGWNTEQNSYDAKYTNGQSVNNLVTTNGGSITLFAIWEEALYTVKFNGNGSTSGSMSNQTHCEDISLALTKNAFVRTGYTFLGWSKSNSATSATYTDGQSVKDIGTAGQTVNLYAVWKANTYTIKFDGNGNTSGTMSDLSMTYDVAKNLTANAFAKTGYHFLGWGTTSSATSVAHTDGKSVNNLVSANGGSITLYAIWQANTYTVKFNSNGGSGTMANQSFTYDISGNLNDSAFTREGYQFRGWSTSASGGVVYSDGFEVKNLTANEDGVVELYAVWKIVQCKVTFIVDGEVYTIVYVAHGTPSDEVIGSAVNSALYEVEGELPN